MRNPIIASLIVVVLFWWLLLWVVGLYRDGLELIPSKYPENESIRVMGSYLLALLGATIIGGLAVVNRRVQSWLMQGRGYRGVSATIGTVPGVLTPSRAVGAMIQDDTRWPLTVDWLANGAQPYTVVFNAVLEVMASKLDHPASPVKGGHGDVALITHSLNVTEVMLSRADSWRLGRETHPLKGNGLTTNDPLIAVIGIAHDLGKLECFVKSGEKWSSKPSGLTHDSMGSVLLARIPEYWQLPEDERVTVSLVVAHRHRPSTLPLYASERTQLLLEFLVDCDVDASDQEGKSGKKRKDSPVPVPQPVNKITLAPEVRAAPASEQPASPVISEVLPPTTALESESQSSPLLADDPEGLWSWFMALLAMPGSINGNESGFRVGFKISDGLLLLDEPVIRKLVAKDYHKDEQMVSNQQKDGRSPLTLALMEIMDTKGLLVVEHLGYEFNWDSAFWQAEARDPKNNKLLNTTKAGILMRVSGELPPNIIAMNPAGKPPVVTAPLLPQRSKRQPEAKVESVGDTADEGGKQPMSAGAARLFSSLGVGGIGKKDKAVGNGTNSKSGKVGKPDKVNQEKLNDKINSNDKVSKVGKPDKDWRKNYPWLGEFGLAILEYQKWPDLPVTVSDRIATEAVIAFGRMRNGDPIPLQSVVEFHRAMQEKRPDHPWFGGIEVVSDSQIRVNGNGA